MLVAAWSLRRSVRPSRVQFAIAPVAKKPAANSSGCPAPRRCSTRMAATAVVLYRKDRVRFIQGREYLTEHRLEPESPTCRVVATCCNSAMFLNFTKGHWLSMYRNRFPPGAPKIEMRVMTRNRRASVALADDAPSYPGHSVKFIVKLLAAWVAMRFRSPKFHLGRNRVDSTRGDAAK